jgi:hypothetical protein
MMQAFLTVGTNPVPVLAAAYRLARHFHQQPLQLLFLHSHETRDDAQTIIEVLQKRLGAEHLNVACTLLNVGNASDPAALLASVSQFVNDNPASHRHLHYTGGRKSMGVKTMQALLRSTAPADFSDSYLDISNHTILNDRGRFTTVTDERREWNLDIRQLLKLHGYTLDFSWKNKATFGNLQKPGAVHLENPALADDAWLAIAMRMLQVLRTDTHFQAWRKWPGRSYVERCSGSWPSLPDPAVVPPQPVLWANAIVDPSWTTIPASINDLFGKQCWSGAGPALDPALLTPEELALLIKLLANGWLELAALDCFAKALRSRDLPFHTYGSFHAAQAPDLPGQPVSRDFEADVFGILGYQGILVSCTTTSSHTEVKLKGFEALHRAQQVGGSGARAIVLSRLNASDTGDLEDELHYETGDIGRRLSIWSLAYWQDLQGKFDEYLNKIYWN